jgi:hypothetical protein
MPLCLLCRYDSRLPACSWRYYLRVWTPFRRTTLSGSDQRARNLVTRAFQEIAGTTNGVVYNVPRTARPRPIPGSIFVRGSGPWRSYLDAREAADDGQPAVLFAFRQLDAEERGFAVDWGTTYPNTFFLVEPSDAACDLTDPANQFTHRINQAVAATLRSAPVDGQLLEGWTRTTPLGELLRELFGTWVYWDGPEPYCRVHEVPLNLTDGSETIWARLLTELNERFPQPAFDRALAYVNDWERELLGGPVPRARSVFRTRLGMPILRDPSCVDRALRRLVNEGRMSVIAPSLPGRPVFDQHHPVPDEISDEEFASFLMR